MNKLESWREKKNWNTGMYALKINEAEGKTGEPLKAADFARLIEKALRIPNKGIVLLEALNIRADAMITRGDAARLIFEATATITPGSNGQTNTK
jgi:hypothetical protein